MHVCIVYVQNGHPDLDLPAPARLSTQQSVLLPYSSSMCNLDSSSSSSNHRYGSSSTAVVNLCKKSVVYIYLSYCNNNISR